jgi:DNA-binding transcriptional MocR family regulator
MLPDQSFLIVSASKAIAAGLRVGFVLAPAESRRQMVDSINASCLGVSPLTVEVLSVWLDDGTVEKTTARRIQDTASRQKLAGELLKGLEFSSHPSSYHLWLKLPEGWGSMRFAMEAQLRGAVITSGEFFCVDQRPPVEAVRLSITVPPTLEILESGIRTISDLLRGQSERDLATV